MSDGYDKDRRHWTGGEFFHCHTKDKPGAVGHYRLEYGVIILVMTLDYLKEAVDFIRDFAEKYSGVYGGVALVLKIIAIAYICEFSVQV